MHTACCPLRNTPLYGTEILAACRKPESSLKLDGFAAIKRNLVLAVDESLYPEIKGGTDTETLISWRPLTPSHEWLVWPGRTQPAGEPLACGNVHPLGGRLRFGKDAVGLERAVRALLSHPKERGGGPMGTSTR